jgi:RNA polymerase sigma factor (sigma-70 family)
MGDRDVVAAIIAGEPAGLATAYDQYAASLHAYCRTLLGEPADAADAVQDTFVVAAAKVSGLRDPGRLRPWLYAVARNECQRRLRARARRADLDEAGEVTDDDADASEQAERAELRGLVLSATGGLSRGDREVIELNLRHDLDGADLADALGVPANQGHALVSRARHQFERSLGALLVARTGRRACAELNALLADWDGTLTPLLRKRVSRHIENCETCGDRKREVLSPAMLLRVLPLVPLPVGLRHQILRLVSDDSPEAVQYCAHVATRAEPFDAASGFPVQLAAGAAAHGRSGRHRGSGGTGRAGRPAPGRSVLASVAVAAGLFLLGGASVAYLLATGAASYLHMTGPQVGSVPSSAAAAAPPPGSAAPVLPSPRPGNVVHAPAESLATPTTVPTSPASRRTSAPPPRSSPPASGSPPVSTSPPASPPVGALGESPALVILTPDQSAAGAPAAAAAATGVPAAAAAGQGAAGPRVTGSRAAGPAAVGTQLTGSAAGGAAASAAAVAWSGTFTLTATGGPVFYVVTAPAIFTVSPAFGTVVPGHPVNLTVSVTASKTVPLLSTLTVDHGGLAVTIEFPPAQPPPSSPPPSTSPPPTSEPPPQDGPTLLRL